jgi:hypothetical protein
MPDRESFRSSACKIVKRILIQSRKQNPDGTVATTSGNVMALISKVKREIVESLRRVVDLLGKYSSSYLPFDARQAVRSFILNLPSRMVSSF